MVRLKRSNYRRRWARASGGLVLLKTYPIPARLITLLNVPGFHTLPRLGLWPFGGLERGGHLLGSTRPSPRSSCIRERGPLARRPASPIAFSVTENVETCNWQLVFPTSATRRDPRSRSGMTWNDSRMTMTDICGGWQSTPTAT